MQEQLIQELKTQVLEVVYAYNLDRMPTHVELVEYFGDSSILGRLKRVGGSNKLAQHLNLKTKFEYVPKDRQAKKEELQIAARMYITIEYLRQKHGLKIGEKVTYISPYNKKTKGTIEAISDWIIFIRGTDNLMYTISIQTLAINEKSIYYRMEKLKKGW